MWDVTSGTLPPTALQASRHQLQFVPAYQSDKSKKNKPRHYKRKPQKPNGNHGYEGLLSLIQGMLWSMANMDMTRKPSPRVKQVWVKKDETIHPMRNQFVVPPILLREHCRYLLGEDRPSDCFSVLASSGLILSCI
jgi:hypothetical protein